MLSRYESGSYFLSETDLSTADYLTSELSFTYNADMTQQQVYRVIVEEIAMLNKEIDLKIIKGRSYAEESRRHKVLLARLKHTSPQPMWWLKRSVNLISALVL